MQNHQACEKQHFKKLLAENFTLYNPSPKRHFWIISRFHTVKYLYEPIWYYRFGSRYMHG